MKQKWRRGKPAHTDSRQARKRKDSVYHYASRFAKKLLPPVATASIMLTAVSGVLANPTGGHVTAGTGTIAQNGGVMTINQATQNLAVNWQNFSIDAGERVSFIQPNAGSVALNRVIGSDASAIYGNLTANGKVFLINPNGVLFAPGSQVNVGGLAASTLDIKDGDFSSGRYTFVNGGDAGSVVNQGTITAKDGGYVAFLGPQVENDGVIAAKAGSVHLAAGDRVSLDFNGDKLLSLNVDAAAAGAYAANSGQILADGGTVVMTARTADTLAGTVVNNSGLIRAQSITDDNGVVRLDGGTRGSVTNSGTLDASGKATGQTGGTIKVLGDKVSIESGAKIDVTGDSGGGTVLVGGNYQGKGPELNATAITVSGDVTIKADAITTGDGGQVVVWSNGKAEFNGTISARGGAKGGDGGNVEVSGKETLVYKGYTDTRAVQGKTGDLLLDPANYTIADSGGDITGEDLGNQLASANVTILSGQGTVNPDGAGDILVNDEINWSGGNTLTLSAYNNININKSISAANGGLTLAANNSGGGNGMTSGIITAPAAVNVKSFTLNGGTWRQIEANLPSFTASDFRIGGGTLIRAKGGDGTSASTAYQITDVYGLQGIGSQGMLGRYYALANNIDASVTATWNAGAGFSPIGSADPYDTGPYNPFIGTFNGQGYTITGLNIHSSNANAGAGLFGSSAGTISNIGLLNCTVDNSSREGEVGGLVGYNKGSITNSYSTGSVTGGYYSGVGGLVGVNNGTITNSYSASTVNSGYYSNSSVGGLVGRNGSGGSVTNSYSTGSVASGIYVGGLVGYSEGSIANSYSTGSVAGGFSNSSVGGLVGQNSYGSIANSYSTGSVTGGVDAGGLVGFNCGTITNSYWDVDTSGMTIGSNYGGGYTGLYSNPSSLAADPNRKSAFSANSYSGWDIAATGGSGSVWRIYDGDTYPLLKSFLTPLTVTANDAAKTYDGQAYNGSAGVTYSNTVNGELLKGSLTYNSGTNAGTYAIILDGLYSGQHGYDIAYDGGTLMINKASLIITATGQNKVYDGTTNATVTYNDNRVNGDMLSVNGTAAFGDKNAGTNKAVVVTGITLSGDDAGNYELQDTTATTTADITKAVLNVTALGQNKVYDGTKNASVIYNDNRIYGDRLNINGTAAFTDKNAGTDKTVNVTDIVVSGDDAGNYDLQNSTATTLADITKAELTAGLTGVVTKTYDGNNTATLAEGNYSLNGIIGSDAVALNYVASGTYDDKNAGTEKSVTVTGLTLSGADSGNYDVNTSASGNVGVIDKRNIDVSAVADTKTYDGTKASELTPTASWLAAGDTISGTQEYANKNAGTGKTLQVIGYAINDGNDGGNYNVTAVNNNTDGIINKAALTAGLTGAVTKTYDGNNGATLTGGNYNLNGVIGSDAVALNYAVGGTYDDKNAGTGKTVTVNGLTLSGADADNYTVNAGATGNVGVIDKRNITVSAVADTKTYDGTKASGLTPTASWLAAGDTISGTQEYANKNAGTGKTLQVIGYAISDGNNGDNYNVTAVNTNTDGIIEKAAVTASLTGAVTKTYDGNNGATLAEDNYSLSGIIGSDAVALNYVASGTYDDKNAGTEKSVTVNGLTLNGTDAVNYTVNADASGNVGVIDKRNITVSAVADTKIYDGTKSSGLTPTASWLAAGDTISGTQEYADKNAGTGKTLQVIGYAINDGNDGGNYDVTAVNTSTAGIINKAELTANLTGTVAKTYDGNNAATLAEGNYSLNGIIGSDAVALNYVASGTYDDKNAGTEKSVTVTGLTLSGADSGNYDVDTSASGNVGVIDKRNIAVSAVADTKTYDGTKSSGLTPTASWLAVGDTISGTQEYTDKNAGTGKTLQVIGYAINDGNDGGNYDVTAVNTSTAGIINKAELTANLTGTVAKTYDGNNTATLTGDNYNLNGVIGSDTVALNYAASGTYDDKNVGTGKTVTVNGLNLSGADAGNYTVNAGATGNVGVIGKRDITVSAVADTKTYDGTKASEQTPTASWLAAGDTISGTQEYADKNAGTGKTLQVIGYAISDGNDGDNYNVTAINTSTASIINKAALTASLIGAVTKTYDGNNAATLAEGNYSLNGIIGSDAVALNYAASGTYEDKNAGTEKSVTVTGLTLSGADSGNYDVNTSASGNVGIIDKRNITVSAVAGTKTYDGTTASELTPTASWLAAGDTISGTQEYADKNAGTGKTLQVIGYAISDGNDGGNYNITAVNTSTAGIINKAALTASLTGAVTKTYDGNNTATLTGGNYNLDGVVSGDTVTLNYVVSGTYDDKNAGTGKAVTVTGLTLSGADADNYTVNAGASGNVGVVDKRNITVSAVAETKTYDGTKASELTPTASWLAAGDTISGTQEYTDKNAGTGKTLQVIGYAINDGNDGDNYNVTAINTNTAGIIEKAAVTASLIGAVTKTYDGNNAATLTSSNYSLSGVIGSDAVALNYVASGTYDDKNAGTEKSVTVTGLTLNGADAGNYTVNVDASGNVGVVDKRNITVSAVADTKTYDGTKASELTPTASWLAAGDTISGTQEYADKNAGTGKTLQVIGYAISDGNDGDNYNVTAINTDTAGIIEKAAVTASLTGTVTKTYDGNNVATLAEGNYSLSGVIGSDAVALNYAAGGTYDDKNAGTGKTVTVNGLTLSGADADNYIVNVGVSGNVGVIDKRNITVSAVADTKTYDGTKASGLTPTASWLAAGDTIIGTQEYADKNAGTGKTLQVIGYAINDGNDGDNYNVTAVNTNTDGIIEKAAVTASLTGAVTKTYDGNNAAMLTGGNYNLDGVVSGDTVALNYAASGTYDNKNAGIGKTVTVNGLTLNGTDAVNYTVNADASGNVGVVDKRNITVSAVADTKIYDGTKASEQTPTASWLAVGDTLSGTQEYIDKNAGTGKTLQITGYAISDGNDGGNYNVTAVNTSTAGIINKAALTASLTGAVTKTYDGNNVATLTADNYNLSGAIGSDAIALNYAASGTYDNKNTGTGKAVTVTGLTLNGADAGNYTVNVDASGNVGVVDKAKLTASLTGTVTKTYDGDNAAMLTAENYSLSGMVFGDNVTVVNTIGSYDDENAGHGKAVTVNGLSLMGDDAGNYTVASSINGNVGIITPAVLIIKANDDSKMYNVQAYTGGNGVSYSGFVNGETSSALSGSLKYGGTSQGAVIAGTYSITPEGLSSNNYAISYVDGVLTVTNIPDTYNSAVTTASQMIFGSGNNQMPIFLSKTNGVEGLVNVIGFPLIIVNNGINLDIHSLSGEQGLSN